MPEDGREGVGNRWHDGAKFLLFDGWWDADELLLSEWSSHGMIVMCPVRASMTILLRSRPTHSFHCAQVGPQRYSEGRPCGRHAPSNSDAEVIAMLGVGRSVTKPCKVLGKGLLSAAWGAVSHRALDEEYQGRGSSRTARWVGSGNRRCRRYLWT